MANMSPELDAVIAEAYSAGHARFGDLGLDLGTFAGRIVFIVGKYLGADPSPEAAVSFVRGLHGRDLYLATACAQHGANSPGAAGAGEAWKILESTYKGYIRDLSRFFFRKGFAAQDLADNILADLFLPDRSGSSRIVSYDGRSSLSTWLRVVVSHRAINVRRSHAATHSVEISSDIPDWPALERIDTAVRKQRYRSKVEDALVAACQSLTARERLILLWRYEDGLLLGGIAEILGIHQSNVGRQLDRLKMKVRSLVVKALVTRHRLSLDAIEECLHDVAENPRTTAILDFIRDPQDVARKARLGAPPLPGPALPALPPSHRDVSPLPVRSVRKHARRSAYGAC